MKKKLPEIFKEKWLIALRSGLFNQAKYALYGEIFSKKIIEDREKQFGHCCLGVACIVAGIPEKNIKELQLPSDVSYQSKNYKKLPKFLLDDDTVSTLATMNDAGKSFKQIANYIEKHY
jgi:hypothetical protein